MKKLSKADLAFLLTFFVFSMILMVNFQIQTVDMHEDDGPIFYATAFANPQLFAGDYLHGIPVELIVPFRLWTSLQMLIPGLLYNFLNIPPYGSTWILTFLQIFGFGSSLYFFLQATGISKNMAWLGVVFAYPAGLWGWSLTYAESDFRSILAPVPAVQSLTPLLFSFAFFIKNKTKSGYLLLLLTGLIHPTMAIYSIGTVSIWRFFQSGFSKLKEFLPHLAILSLISVVIAAPSFIIKNIFTFNTLPLDQVMNGMRLNIHIWPWGFGLHWPPLQTTLIWIFIGFLGYRANPQRDTRLTNLWIASLISSVIFGLSHIFGAVIKNTTLLDLIGLRSFAIPVFLSFPLVLSFFQHYYFSRGYYFRFITLLFLSQSLVTKQYGLSWLLAISLALLVIAESSRERLVASLLKILNPRAIRGIALVLTGTFIVFLFLGDRVDQLEFPYLVLKIINFFFDYQYLYPDLRILGLGVLAIGLIAVLDYSTISKINNKFITNHISDLFKAGSIAILALSIIPQLIDDQNPEALARLDIQKWARTNTPPGSVFWAPGFNGWRSFSERRRVDDTTRENYAYIYAIEEAEDYRMKVLEFYGLVNGSFQIPLNTDLYKIESDLAKGFTEQEYEQMANEFDVTHLVLKRIDFAVPNLPLLYKNAYFDVYESKEK
jgi:hypothetical protein